MTNHQSWNVSYTYTFSSPMIVHQKKKPQVKTAFPKFDCLQKYV